MRSLPTGFVPPCLPISDLRPPSGPEWAARNQAFRCIARKSGQRVKLYSRPGNDLTDRFPLIVEAVAELSTRSCIIDGRRWRVVQTASPALSECGIGATARANSCGLVRQNPVVL